MYIEYFMESASEHTLFTHEYVVDVSGIKWAQRTSVICDLKKKKKKQCAITVQSNFHDIHHPVSLLFQIFPNC